MSTSKDELPEPRESSANEVTSHAIEQANQEVRKTIAIHDMCQTKCQMHSNFCIFKFHVRFNLVY